MSFDHATRLSALRAKISTHVAQIDALKDAPIPKSDAIAKLDQWINICGQVDHRSPPRVGVFSVPDLNMAHISPLHPNAEGYLFEIFGQQIREHYVTELEKFYQSVIPGPPLSERPKLMADLRSKLFELEVQEETVIVEAEREGKAISRRPDVDPRVLVSVL